MSKKPQRTHPHALMTTNIFGTLGYLSVLLQWTWTLLILCYPLLVADHSFLLPTQPVQPVHPSPDGLATSPVMVVIAVAATAFILALTVVIIIRLPRKIGLRGARITHQTASIVVPLVAKRKLLPKKKQRELSYKVILTVKALLILLPIIGLLYTPAATPLSGLAIWSIGIFCASWSIFYFVLQQLIGFLYKILLDKLW